MRTPPCGNSRGEGQGELTHFHFLSLSLALLLANGRPVWLQKKKLESPKKMVAGNTPTQTHVVIPFPEKRTLLQESFIIFRF